MASLPSPSTSSHASLDKLTSSLDLFLIHSMCKKWGAVERGSSEAPFWLVIPCLKTIPRFSRSWLKCHCSGRPSLTTLHNIVISSSPTPFALVLLYFQLTCCIYTICLSLSPLLECTLYEGRNFVLSLAIVAVPRVVLDTYQTLSKY